MYTFSLSGISIPCHYYIPPYIDILSSVRQPTTCVNELPCVVEPIDKGCLEIPRMHTMILLNTEEAYFKNNIGSSLNEQNQAKITKGCMKIVQSRSEKKLEKE